MMRAPCSPDMHEDDQVFLARFVGRTADLAEAVADFRERVEAQIASTDALLDRHERFCAVLIDELQALFLLLDDAACPRLQQRAATTLRRLRAGVAEV
jgi:hypothetical protein